ncbi:Protein ABHD11 [Holothuria leucospilota]|uniref:sn-1-specific diacylglycerol lipase ABHD11 n=1 Tax=Holothuria leucospilota TaxID=206669 RepID=A0A9Q1CE78_HOLLE|nr:Protein ABHD11 [Holothuria leucospilota]
MMAMNSRLCQNLLAYRTSCLTHNKLCLHRRLARLIHVSPLQREAVKLSYNVYHGNPTDQPVVILHGILASRTNFDGIAKQLAKLTGRKVVTVDARNHGDSEHSDKMGYEDMALDIVKMLSEIKAKSCTPIGHSLGGRTSMTLALMEPELVDKLAVIDVSPVHQSQSKEVLDILLGMQNAAMPERANIVEARRYVGEQLRSSIPDDMVRGLLLNNLVQRNGQMMWRVNVDAMLSHYRKLGSIPEDKPPFTRGPALFIGGSLSDYITEKDHPNIYRYFPKAEIKMIEGATHWIHYEKPQELVRLLAQFIHGH